MTPRRWGVLTAVAVAAIVVLWTAVRYTRSAHDTAAGPAAPGGEKVAIRFFKNPAAVPAIAMHDIDGRAIAADSLRGKVVIVNFWATWCPPCRAEIPDLVALQEKYGDRLQIIGVSQDEAPVEVVRRFANDHHVNYPIVMMTPELDKAFPGIAALPTSFIVDRESRIVQRHVGMLNAVLTENETRALAGLPVNATIEEVDRAQPAKLENAQATQIPGIDLAKLSPEKRTEALQKLNTEPCTCGCENTVAKCRVDDPKCTTSLPLAQRIVQDITGQ